MGCSRVRVVVAIGVGGAAAVVMGAVMVALHRLVIARLAQKHRETAWDGGFTWLLGPGLL